MAKYKAYPEYKDSGVEWLGDIPKHWQRFPLKYLVEMKSGESITAADIEPEGHYPVFGGNGLRGYSSKYTHSGSYVLIGRQGALCGNVNYAHNQFWASEHALVVKGKKSFNIRWLGELLRAMNLNQYSITAAQPGLSAEALVNLQIPVPPAAEREVVASFISYEAEKIDNLIEKQKQLIELLKEKRQAVISHAVTKGLNPDVPMKDSGVEWLGEVPEHWIIKRLKHISPKIGVGLVINPSTYTKDEGVYFIFGGDVKEFRFDLTKARRISPQDSNKLLPSRLNSRDLVSVRVGYPGVTSVVTDELDGSNCASIIIIRRGDYNSNWLCAAMNVWVGRQQVDLASYGAAQKQFNVADAIEFVFPVPPISEQDDIAKFVQKTLNKFDDLTLKALNQIDLLQERRTALISAAVTGKIDVRDWVAPDSSEIANIEESPEVNA
ncbi:restriction endonuclease subunit S [Dickeya zeae]|uniref:restriction endonuclease subunit S n=1 Tax=Dickeya zeae TaxID=204042 RepID=UPI00039A0F85|nr:restriction endonuclease subunit S [Dickeya zeae]